MGEVLLTVRPGTQLALKYAMLVGDACGVRVVSTADWDAAGSRLLVYFHEVPDVILHGKPVLDASSVQKTAANTSVCVVFVHPGETWSTGAAGIDLDAEKAISGATMVLDGFHMSEHGGLAAAESADALAALREIVQSFYAGPEDDGARERSKLVFDGDVDVDGLDVTYVQRPNEARTYVVMQVQTKVNSFDDIDFQNRE